MGSRAFKVEGKRHAWDLQDPDLLRGGLERGLRGWRCRKSMLSLIDFELCLVVF